MPALGERLTKQLNRIGPGLRGVMSNMGWLMVDRVVRLGMNLVVSVWVARYLGPQLFGSLNFAIAFIALFGSLASLGLESIVIREVLHRPEETHEILGTTLAMRVAGGLLGMVASVATLRLIEPHDKQAQVLVGILSLNLFFLAFDTIDSFFQSQVQSKITVWAKNLAFLIFAGVRIALVYSKAPVWCFAVANVGEIGLGAAGLVIGYRLSGGKMLSWRVHRPRAVYLIQQSWPVLLSGMAVMIYMRIDMVMLKLMQGDLAVGLYSAATRVSEVWYFVPTAIVSSVSPAILRVKDDPELFHLRMRRLFSIMTMTSCLISFVIAPCSRTIIHMLYSTGYSAAAPVLAIHIWASVFVFMGVAQSPWNLSKDLLKLSLYWTVAGAVINVALNLYLIPRYSAMGAAIATVVAYAFSGFFANLFSARTRPIFVMQVRSFIPMRLWN